MNAPFHDTFELYVDDDRYAVPTLHLITATSAAQAQETAERILGESAHHLGRNCGCPANGSPAWAPSPHGARRTRPRPRAAAFSRPCTVKSA